MFSVNVRQGVIDSDQTFPNMELPTKRRAASSSSMLPTQLLIHTFSFLPLHDIARNRRLSRAARKCLTDPLLFTAAHILRPAVPALHAESALLRVQSAFVLQYLTRLNILVNQRYDAAWSSIDPMAEAAVAVRSQAQSLARSSVIPIIARFCNKAGKEAVLQTSGEAPNIAQLRKVCLTRFGKAVFIRSWERYLNAYECWVAKLEEGLRRAPRPPVTSVQATRLARSKQKLTNRRHHLRLWKMAFGEPDKP